MWLIRFLRLWDRVMVGVVHVISEGRIIDLSGGYFADSFEPLGTHIYKIALN